MINFLRKRWLGWRLRRAGVRREFIEIVLELPQFAIIACDMLLGMALESGNKDDEIEVGLV
jgi:hypothetical protein